MRKLMTMTQVADEIGASVQSIRRLVRYDEVPYVRLSEKIVRIHPDNVGAVEEALRRPRKRSLRVPLSEVEDCKVPERCPAQEDMDPRNHIYFIKSGPFVKIGFSTNTKYRMKHLQIASPHELELLFEIMGDKLIENYVHLILKDHHHRGEWFHINETVQQFMNVVMKGYPIDEARMRIMRGSPRTLCEPNTAHGAKGPANDAN
tara:strand:+ start:1173 stop:1784 length:612 start_codon:yes stop_codon:yes gene_type:complete